MDLAGLRKQSPYLVFQLRPVLGECFFDSIKTYQFWGVIDIDVLLGNTALFLTKDVLSLYDVIPFTNIVRGNIILYKNCLTLRTLWRKVPDYQTLINKYVIFDETYFAGALMSNKDISIHPHTKTSNWTADFRWRLFEGLRKQFWVDDISEIIYDNSRIYDKHHARELAAVVLDALSKWSQYYEFNGKGACMHFYDPEYDYYNNPIENITDPARFYKVIEK